MQLRLVQALVGAFQPSALTRQRRAEGVCLSCGAKPAKPGYLACRDCAARVIDIH
jgi:hypothetical protein